MKIWVEKLGNTLFGVNSRIRTRDGICCQGILLPRFTGRSLDKNNEIISTLQASSSITDKFGGQFVQETSPWSSYRIMHWIFQKKKKKISLVNTTDFYKNMLYKLLWFTVVRYWVRWLYSIILWNRDIFSQMRHSTCSFSTKTANLVSKHDEIYFTSRGLQFTPNQKPVTKYDMVTSLRNFGLKTFAIFLESQ